MAKVKRPYCGGSVKKFGGTGAGSQRWGRLECAAAFTRKIDNAAKLPVSFPSRLMSGKRRRDMRGGGRTFRGKCSRFRSAWPTAPETGGVHRVAFADGIYPARNVVVLIASTEKRAIGWHMARSENSRAWSALMAPMPPPEVAATDGGPGFEKAGRRVWPETKVRRCVFHAFCQVKGKTTTRPNLQAGVELHGLAKGLLHVMTAAVATSWLQAHGDWCARWDRFLSEKTLGAETGRWDWIHARLVTARNGLNTLIRRGVPFTLLDPELVAEGPPSRTNNRLEGGVNAQLRDMLRKHRGLSALRCAKAVFRWRCMYSERPPPAAEILRVMPTDDDIAELYQLLAHEPQKRDGLKEWGGGLVWSELHHSAPWRIDWD